MLDARTQLDRQYHEMRWRILSLAADLDRLQRLKGGEWLLIDDLRVSRLRNCVRELLSNDAGRAERVQMLLSDMSPDPRDTQSGAVQ
jgi:hypothetical protein